MIIQLEKSSRRNCLSCEMPIWLELVIY